MNEQNRHDDPIADCRLRAVFDLFAHTWDPVVLAALRLGPRRRTELRAEIGGISDKALTETLRRLLGYGLVARRPHAEAPPRVEYLPTPLGTTLIEGPLTALASWVRDHGDELSVPDSAASTSLRRAGLPAALTGPTGSDFPIPK